MQETSGSLEGCKALSSRSGVWNTTAHQPRRQHGLDLGPTLWSNHCFQMGITYTWPSAAWHCSTQNTSTCWCNTDVRGTRMEHLGFCRSAVPWAIYSALKWTVLKPMWFLAWYSTYVITVLKVGDWVLLNHAAPVDFTIVCEDRCVLSHR